MPLITLLVVASCWLIWGWLVWCLLGPSVAAIWRHRRELLGHLIHRH